MCKYKVGDELIIVKDPNEDIVKLKELTQLKVDGDFAQISLGLKILDVEYNEVNVILTNKNIKGEKTKVFSKCNDVENFDEQKVLEKALLRAFQNELINLSVFKNNLAVK